MRRIAVVGDLRLGAIHEARRLLEEGPPFDLAELGCARHDIYLSEHDVVFVFEGIEPDRLMDAARNVVGVASLAAWMPLLDGVPRMAEVAYSWSSDAVNDFSGAAR